MKLPEGEWLHRREVASTQDIALAALKEGREVAVVLADHQTSGRGRQSREWLSGPADSLTVSIAMTPYSDHPKPWLVGMALALAFAEEIGCRLQWPNDLVSGGRKLGGVLTEICACPLGQVPVIGVGVNLHQREFPPEIAQRATSVRLEFGEAPEALDLLRGSFDRLATFPEPCSWSALEDRWSQRDSTPGKPYRTAEEEGTALGIDREGALLL
ncbi:MAG TPA: biotin--[acetyl-CoA-carboxylase] ligase, partial [Fimbriimonadaceae bacterium]|nr:biotin--[acetyl-CoA-carboxylase] ligase [Fimbriimonadaceae bacterium]